MELSLKGSNRYDFPKLEVDIHLVEGGLNVEQRGEDGVVILEVCVWLEPGSLSLDDDICSGGGISSILPP